MKEEKEQVVKKELSYIEKVWHTAAIVALLISVVLIARVAFNILLMVLAGALISVYFHGLGDIVERKTRLSRKWAMTISVTLSFVILGLLFWFMGSKIQVQVAELSNTLPHTVNVFKEKLSESVIGQKILDNFSGDNEGNLSHTIQAFFSTSFGVLGDIYIIIFLGIFFTSNPDSYKKGILLLVPKPKKELGKHILDRVSLSLKGWLKSMMISIVLITILIATGLSIISIPLAMVLALIAGILKLIPNLGSLLAMIPGVLLALTISTNTAIVVAILYIVSQTIVSNIVTPLIQKKMIDLPPALTLISQLMMGVLSGALGIILAVPLLSILIILVDELYVKKINEA
jgi:predicted PurR-regulated permease PerM